MEQTQQNGSTGGTTGGDSLADSRAASGNARDKLVEDLKHAIGEAESWLGDTAKHGAEQASDTRARFEDTLRTAKSDLRKLEDSMLARGRSAAQSADGYVKDNPWKAVTLGATVGVLVGLLIART